VLAGGGEAISPTFCLGNAFPRGDFSPEPAELAVRGTRCLGAVDRLAGQHTGQVPVSALNGQDYSSWSPVDFPVPDIPVTRILRTIKG
jgi:hypothetical protein